MSSDVAKELQNYSSSEQLFFINLGYLSNLS